MAFKHLIGGMTLLAVLVGCSSNDTAPTEAAPPAHSDGTCSADRVQGLLGKVATADTVEQARLQSGARTARVLSPGDMVTLEYDSQRLNIDITEAEIIERIACG
ncbi:I78 family peptidase inhibitor [Phytopseudomonas dryadis]|uniref:Peptidase inhibitor I78 family protein n=1 Tax=Phytopseudomonas dryadis TaxID=2487520 RepID=A0A4Q9QXQ0_9GAMM|nr:I78 family peptidase inhibitor [Pseudomonas dryadis]TBU89760.1 peptidase inhibitor I78 family protein [Pseudomonas dryadis]